MTPWQLVTDRPDALDPLEPLRHAGGDLADECLRCASMLTTQAEQAREPFWYERAESLLAGVMAMYATTTDGPGGLQAVYDLLAKSDAVYNMAVLLDRRTDLPPFALAEIGSFTALADITRSGILSTAVNAVRLLGSERVARAVGPSTFDLGAVTRGDPMTIYLVVPPANLRSHAGLVRLWLSTLLALVTARRRLPPKPTLWLLDEFAQLGPMPQLVSAVTLSRGYGMRCLLFLQSLGQLRSAYPTDHEAIVEDCAGLVTFGHTTRPMSAKLAELLGDIPAETLYRLPKDAAAVRCGGHDTRIVRRLDYLTNPLFVRRADPHPMHAESERPKGNAKMR